MIHSIHMYMCVVKGSNLGILIPYKIYPTESTFSNLPQAFNSATL